MWSALYNVVGIRQPKGSTINGFVDGNDDKNNERIRIVIQSYLS